MGLVDGDEANLHVAQLRLEKFRREAFGRYIEDAYIAEDTVLEGDNDLLSAKSRIDGCCSDATTQEMVHLVFHQGNQRGDNDACSLLGKCWYLKGDRLTTSRRHQPQRVMSTADRLDDLTLNTAKIIVTPILSENLPVIINYQLSIIIFRRLNVLDLQLHLAALVDIVLDGVDNVERTLRLDESCRLTLSEGNAIEHIA